MKQICLNCGAFFEGTHACSKEINEIKKVLDSNGLDEQFCTEGIAQEIVNQTKEKWEKEFEDNIIIDEVAEGGTLELQKRNENIDILIYEMIGKNKVKIKARKGKIVIERID